MLREIFVRISIRWGDSYLALKDHEATASMQSSSLLAPPTGNKNCLQKNLAENEPTSSSPSSSSWSQADPTWVEWQESCSEKSYGKWENKESQRVKMRTNTRGFHSFQATFSLASHWVCEPPLLAVGRGVAWVQSYRDKNCGMDSWPCWSKNMFGGIFNDPIQKKKALEIWSCGSKKVSTSNQTWIFNIQVHFRSTTGQQESKQSRLAVVSGQ